MMPLPEKFDQNEWFVLITLFLSFLVIILLPKKMPVRLAILMMIFSLTVARLADHLLATPRHDLYNIMDSGKFDAFDLVLYLVYAPFGYIFVYVYEWLKVKGYWILIYILLWSIFGAFFEWVSVQFKVFVYNGWELKYSFTFYVASQAITLLLYIYLKKGSVKLGC
jgi:hypothetical protein